MIPFHARCLRTGVVSLLLGLACAFGAAAAVRVEIEGLEGDERDNVQARLGLRTRAAKGPLDESLIRRLHLRAPQDIREALQPFGYYEPQVESRLERDGDDWIARYRVDRGPATRVTAIDTRFEGEGQELAALQARLQGVPLKLERRLQHAEYEATKKRMSDAALAQGFLDARWRVAELRVDPALRSAQVRLHLDTGPRYYFGPVSIEQQGLDPDFLQRYVGIEAGAPFDPQQLLELQFRLSDLGYFEAVEIDPRRDEADAARRVPVSIRTTPRKRTRYDVGVGYGTDTGARISLGTDWRRLNRHGHTVNTDLRLSQIKNTLGAKYNIPLGQEPGESLSFTTTGETETLEDGDTRKYTLGTALTRQPGDWTRKVYLEFAHEESDFGDSFATADLLTPGVAFTRTVADDPIYTRRGWYAFADVHGALEDLLSSASFLQARLLLRGVQSPTARLRLIARAEFGYSLVEEFNELPASQRFFAGGDQSVRGYRYQSLGPRDAQGNVVGGRYLNVFSGEAEYRVWNNWGAALFVDSGGAADDPGPDLSTGVGVGLRYRAPIGSLQLDLAHPLDQGESGVRVHIGVRVGV